MALSTAQMTLIEQRVTNESPSTGAAYLLWLFVWFLSGHRVYLRRPGTAILQILSYFIFIGFLWVLIDAFLIPGMIRDEQEKIRRRMMLNLLANGGS
jgi:TM2 domain-containing membrane protein YozV